MKSANEPSGRSIDGNVLEPDQRDFSGDIEGLRRLLPVEQTDTLK